MSHRRLRFFLCSMLFVGMSQLVWTIGASASTPSVMIATSSNAFGGVVISPDSQTAYLTVPSQNQVAVLNLKTGTFGIPINVGSQPEGIDITPDGTTLYVCDSGGQAISVVDIATASVTKTITFPGGFSSEKAWQIAIGNNKTAIFTTTFAGSGFGAHAYQLDLTTNTVIGVAPGIGTNGPSYGGHSGSA